MIRRSPGTDATPEGSAIFIDHVTVADLDDAARTLTAAFDAYPWTRWSIPADGYRDRLQRLQRMYLGYAFDHGIVLATQDLSGVIALLPPDAPEPDEQFHEAVARLHGDRLAAVAGAHTPAPPEGTWSLATLGVHPDSQGKGLGSALVRAGLGVVDETDPPGARVALETSDDRNVQIYERAGFMVTATTPVDAGLVVHSMLREPGGDGLSTTG
ncbi:GNAT family N-acetyltransferase [Gordonia sp. NPDC058843]|uniref:GNAT family N-acetyltransferase n=1 Tax=Gordonia sp. NPDC058843 TaxID=3346648 RepID=UPI00369F8918